MLGTTLAFALFASPSAYFVDAELHAGVVAEAGNTQLFRALGVLGRVGRRWDDLGVFIVSDLSTWRSPVLDQGSERQAALNLGLGFDALFLDGLVRSTSAIGASVLLRGTAADEPGSTGMFVDLRPLAYRWSVSDDWHVNFAPLGMAMLMPVMTGIPLVELQFRTGISGEFGF